MAHIIISTGLLCLCLMAALFKQGRSQFTTAGCGTTKGCFLSPTGCAGSTDCEFFASWVYDANNNQVNFRISGQATSYVALGLSKSGGMDNSDVYACTKSNTILRSQNTGYTNNPQTLKGIDDLIVSVNNGRIECEFTRDALLTDNDVNYFDISGSNTYTVIMAKSNDNLPGDGKLVYHGSANRVFDSTPVSFTKFTSPTMPTQPPGGSVLTTKQNINTDFTTDGCGTTKGCFLNPTGCAGSTDCEFFASWVYDANNNQVNFQISGQATSYVALGLSKSGGMDNSDVCACTKSNTILRSQNTGYTNNPQTLKGISGLTVSVNNGRIECEFTRKALLNDNDVNYFDISGSNMYTVIMAKSNNNLAGDGKLVYHGAANRVFDSTPVSFTKFTSPAMPTQPPGGSVLTTKQNINTDLTSPAMLTQPPEDSVLTTKQNINTDDTTGCGTTKGCFQSPNGCSGSACEYSLSWSVNADGNNVFEMTGNLGSYVALGFSKSGQMRDSEVYACTSNNEVVRSRNTVDNTNDPSPSLKGVSDVTVSVVDGKIQCMFTRQPSLDDNDATYYNLIENEYTIIMSKSNDGLQPDGNINYHTGGRVIGGKTSFDKFTSVKVNKNNRKLNLQKTHGCLMVIAWLGLASIGLTMARYFKPIFPDTKIMDTAVWFQVHRAVMILAVSCTIIAFILIFVSVEGFVDSGQGDTSSNVRYTHAILGVIVTILAIVNPIMAIFRPHPGEPKRVIFNWAHWSVGTSAHITGLIVICLALGVGESRPLISGLPSYAFWIMIVFIIFHVVMWSALEVRSRCKKEVPTDIPMTDPSAHSSQAHLADTKSSQKDVIIDKMCFFTYLTVVIIFIVIMIISIAIVEP